MTVQVDLLLAPPSAAGVFAIGLGNFSAPIPSPPARSRSCR